MGLQEDLLELISLLGFLKVHILQRLTHAVLMVAEHWVVLWLGEHLILSLFDRLLVREMLGGVFVQAGHLQP